MSTLDANLEEDGSVAESNASKEQISHNEDSVASIYGAVECERDRRSDGYTRPDSPIQNEPFTTYQVPNNIHREYYYLRTNNGFQLPEYLLLPCAPIQPNDYPIFVFRPYAFEYMNAAEHNLYIPENANYDLSYFNPSSGIEAACSESKNDISEALTASVPEELLQNPPSTAAQCETTSKNTEVVVFRPSAFEDINAAGHNLYSPENANDHSASNSSSRIEATCAQSKNDISEALTASVPEELLQNPSSTAAQSETTSKNTEVVERNVIEEKSPKPCRKRRRGRRTRMKDKTTQTPIPRTVDAACSPIRSLINIIEYEEPTVPIDQLPYPEDEIPQHLDAQHPNQIFNPDDPANSTEHNSSTKNEEYQGPAYLGNHSNDRWIPCAINIIEYEEYEPPVPLDQLTFPGVIPLYLEARYPDETFYPDDPQNDIPTAHLCSTEYEEYQKQAYLGKHPTDQRIRTSINLTEYEESETAVPLDQLPHPEGETLEYLFAQHPNETFYRDDPQQEIVTHLPENISSTENEESQVPVYLGNHANDMGIQSSLNTIEYEEPGPAEYIAQFSYPERELLQHDIITHLPDRICSTKNEESQEPVNLGNYPNDLPTEEIEADENNTEAMNPSLPPLYGPPFSEEIDPTENYSRAVITDNGLISFFLQKDIRIDITVDRAIRIQNSKTNTTLGLSANGKRAALVHEIGTAFQCGARVACIVNDKFANPKSHKYAKLWWKGVSFTAGNNSVAYLLDSGGLHTNIETFPALDYDVTLDVFYSDSTHGPDMKDQALRQLWNTVYWKDNNNAHNWVINNVKISQTPDGFVRVQRSGDKYVLRFSPRNECVFLGSPFLYCAASLRHFFLRRGEQRVHYDGVFSVKNGGQGASFDQRQQIILL